MPLTNPPTNPPTDPPTEWDEQLRGCLAAASAEAGFDAWGVAAAQGDLAGERFVEWVEAGRAGEMEWLKRRDEAGVLVRSGVRVALPWARSVVVCAMNYHAEAPRSVDSAQAGAGWIGRYAWSGRETGDGVAALDYHDDLLARLRAVEAGLAAKGAGQTRCYVDTGPLVERDAAVRAGIGWVGKNTCVLRAGVGSWMLLGVIVCALPISAESVALEHPDRCGSCTRCLDACPTGALVAPRQMDASRCIAYLTIEKKGEIAEDLRRGMGRQVFGCDICQEVCPWNGKAPIAIKPGLTTRSELVNPALDWLASLDAPGFRRVFRGSPLERTGRRRLRRNVAIAMGNSGDRGFVPTLREWAEGDDAVLAESARWALARLDDASSGPGLDGAALLAFEGGGALPPGHVDADQPKR